MKSEPSAVIERPAIAPGAVEKIALDREALTGSNNVKLEAFTVRLAWIFASSVFLLVVIGLVLVVAGYAGSVFAPDKHPKQPTPASWPRK